MTFKFSAFPLELIISKKKKKAKNLFQVPLEQGVGPGEPEVSLNLSHSVILRKDTGGALNNQSSGAFKNKLP